ncbi:MAG: GntR family transcriptional regulator [Oceanicaulis sp.]
MAAAQKLKPARTRSTTHAERIARAVSEEIMAGKRTPGSHLSEQELAERFSVSRTPVREAMRQLASAGMIETHPHRGAFVLKVSATHLIALFEAASEIEGVCARFAARRMTEAEKQELKAVHEGYRALADAGQPVDYFEASLEFHRRIFNGSKNAALAEIAAKLFERLTPYRRRQVALTHRTSKSFAEHQAVLDAILASDSERAEQLMRDHTGIVTENVLDILSAIADD